MKVQANSREITFFRYPLDVIIVAAYPNSVPLRNAVCNILIEVLLLANSFLVFSIDVWVIRTITLVMVFVRSSLMVLYRIFIVALTIWVRFRFRLSLLYLALCIDNGD